MTWRVFMLVGALALALHAPAQARDVTLGIRTDTTSIDPQFHVVASNVMVAHYAFDQLILQDEKQRLVPGLAVSWQAVGPTTWEFRLRPGVRFHDGTPFTADDVAFSLARAPLVPNSPTSFAIYTKSIAHVDVVDPLTIRIETKSPAPLLPYDMSAISILSRHAAEGKSTNDFNSGAAAIGTGPYRFVRWIPGNRIEYVANPDYWGGKQPWDHVTLKPIANDGAREAALLSGDIDLMEGVPVTDVNRLRRDPAVSIFQCDSNRVIYIQMDTARDKSPGVSDANGNPMDRNPLRDLRVRQAMTLAIDRPALTSRLLDGQARPAGQLVPDGFAGASPALHPLAADPAKARALLSEAGYKQGFRLTLAATNDRYPLDVQAAEAIAQMFTRVGIRTQVDAMPAAMLFSRGSALDFSALIAGAIAISGESSSELVQYVATYDPEKSMGPSNRGRYSNPEFDRTLEQALQTMDQKQREALLGKATEIAIDDVGIIPVYFLVNTWAARKGLVYVPRSDEATLATGLKPAP